MQSSDIDVIQHGSGGFGSTFSLDLSNPNIWVTKVKIRLKQVEAYDIIVNVDDLEEEPILPAVPTPEEIAALDHFKKRRRFGYSIITNSLLARDNTVYLAKIIDTAYDSNDLPAGWESLMQTLYIVAPGNRRKLQEEFLSIKQHPNESVQAYADRIDDVNQQYSLCTDLHEGFEEDMVCSQFLNGLSPTYEIFVAAVELSDNPLTYRATVKKAQLFEIKQNAKVKHTKESHTRSPFSKHEVPLLYSSDAQRHTYGQRKPPFTCTVHGRNFTHDDDTCRVQNRKYANTADEQHVDNGLYADNTFEYGL